MGKPRELMIFLVSLWVLFFGADRALTALDSALPGEMVASKTDPELGWDFVGRHGNVTYNDLGIREDLSSKELRRAANPKVVFLGSSVVLGAKYPLDRVMTGVAESALSANGPLSPIVLNSGFDGYEIYREFLKYRRDVAVIRPQVVVWCPTRNDFIRKAEVRGKVEESNQVHHVVAHPPTPWQRMKTFAYFDKLAARIYSLKAALAEDILTSDHNSYYTNGLTQDLGKDLLDELENEIASFHRFVRSQGARLIVVFLPSRAFLRGHTWRDAHAFQQLQGVLNHLGIPSFGLFDLFADKQDKLFSDFIHLDEQGHARVGNAVASLVARYIDPNPFTVSRWRDAEGSSQ